MGFLTANRKRTRKRLRKDLKLRVQTLRKLQGGFALVPEDRKAVRGLYSSDDSNCQKDVRRAHFLIEEERRALAQALTLEHQATNLIFLPVEIIHEIFLYSGNLELPNCCKILHKQLTDSEYLERRMVLRLSSTIRPPKPPPTTNEGTEDENSTTAILPTPVRVINSRFLGYKFVSRKILEELNILYSSPDFTVNNAEDIDEKDIASVSIPTEFNDLLANERTIAIYLHFLAQPNVVENRSCNQSIFVNMCMEAGFVDKVHEILDYGKVTTDETTLKIALSLGDMELFTKVTKAAKSPDVLSSDLIWEMLLLTQNHEAISVIRQEGGAPSLHALSFGMSQS